MLLRELTEARVTPDVEFMDQVEDILDASIEEYSEYLDNNNDQDDIFELEEILNSNNDNDLPIEFIASDQERQDPNEWISAMAGIDKKGPFMKYICFQKT